MTDGAGIWGEIALRWMLLDLADDKVNIGLGNGLVPSGKRDQGYLHHLCVVCFDDDCEIYVGLKL